MSRSYKKNWSISLSDKFFKKEHHKINRQKVRQELIYNEEADVVMHQSEYDKSGTCVWNICDYRKYQGPGRTGWRRWIVDNSSYSTDWKKNSWSRKLKMK